MKKSKWILNLTLSIVTMMIATEVLAKGGGTPGSPSGRINEVIVDGARFNPSAKAYMRYRIQMDRIRSNPNMSKVKQRKIKREIKRELCMDTCKQNFGEFYNWANKLGWIGASGALTSAGMSLLQNKTRRELKREGLRRIHDPDPRKYKSGRALLSWSNVIKGFGKLSFKVGLLASAGQAAMWSYCNYYKCGKSKKG
jgi:hypothetical protein